MYGNILLRLKKKKTKGFARSHRQQLKLQYYSLAKNAKVETVITMRVSQHIILYLRI